MSKPYNILLLLSDEHSFRCMGHVPPSEGGEDLQTPTFDALAEKGIRFTNTYCQSALCTPSRMSMFTGLEAQKCGAWDNGAVLRPELPTLPKMLSQSNFSTCLIGKAHLGGTNQMGGFQTRPYGDLTGQIGHQYEPLGKTEEYFEDIQYRTRDVGVTRIPESQHQEHLVAEEGLAWVREVKHRNPDQPWFLTLSFCRPHFPLTAPARHFNHYWPDGVTPPQIGPTGDAFDHPMSCGMRKGFKAEHISDEQTLRARAAYFACVSYLDEIVGDLLTRMKSAEMLEDTIIVYTSDHGELAGEHGVWWKHGWYEACTRVPLIVSLPDHRRGELAAKTYRTPVGLIDLFPTLCSLTKSQVPLGLDGFDLSDSVRGKESPPDRPVVCDNLIPRWGEGTEFRMVRRGNYKYVQFRDAPPLLFDLEKDPDEQINIFNSPLKDQDPQVADLISFARDSINFKQAEEARTIRDADLLERYRLHAKSCRGNLYWMEHGNLVDAEDLLYRPRVVLSEADKKLV